MEIGIQNPEPDRRASNGEVRGIVADLICNHMDFRNGRADHPRNSCAKWPAASTVMARGGAARSLRTRLRRSKNFGPKGFRPQWNRSPGSRNRSAAAE